jgi:hypothetical protein
VTDPTPLPAGAPTPSSNSLSLWPFWTGLLLIGLGALLLLGAALFQNDNWWAIFIFLPAASMLGLAWLGQALSRGAFNLWVRLNLSLGLIVLAVALIFALDLDWGLAWTLMLIVPGLAIFLNGFTYPRLRLGSPLGSAANMQFWLGASVVMLGVTFLLNQLGAIDLAARFGTFHWWWVFILVPAAGALINALAVYRASGPHPTADSLLALSVMLAVDAGAEYLALNWQWRVPLSILLGGLTLLAAGLRPR